MFKCVVLILFVAAVFNLSVNVAENIRKPPFNGSIFGKRALKNMELLQAETDVARPACEFVFNACKHFYSWPNGQANQPDMESIDSNFISK
ncbi:FMRFamide-related neuropeptides-like [Uloborus diversus]|uniref:FMRFamide-related neuropeptides-like n=1 Tax=Uloborus diversus TaxID=327109 RepID=UPI0024098B4F|nr:FMRFamide-related neuropeptides-like [Uloborus diversus]